jgi:hypothetical protein
MPAMIHSLSQLKDLFRRFRNKSEIKACGTLKERGDH